MREKKKINNLLDNIFDNKNVNEAFILKSLMRIGQILKHKNKKPTDIEVKSKGKRGDSTQVLKIGRGILTFIKWEKSINTKDNEMKKRVHILLTGLEEMGFKIDKSLAKMGYIERHSGSHGISDVLSNGEIQELKKRVKESREKYGIITW